MRGKIARLPREVREELNQRLDNGEMGSAIVDWLNSLSETQEVVQAHFQGNEITEQNLSEWRQGGFQEWLVREETLDRVWKLRDDAEELAPEMGGRSVADDMAAVISARYAALLADWNGEISDEFQQKTRALRRLCRDVAKLRRGDATAMRVKLDLERLREANFTNMDRFTDLFAPMVRDSKESMAAYTVLKTLAEQMPK